MSGTRRNVAANIAGRVWGAVSLYLFVPIYLRLLGPEAYGVVGFYTVLTGVLVIADLGLTSTMSREMARLGARPGGADERRDLARSLEWLYVGIALLIGIGVVLGAPAIASRWLQARSLTHEQLVEALRLMGAAIALQLPTSFYFGGLQGLERQTTANGLQIGYGLLRSGGGALAIWLLAPTLHVFFTVVLAANLIYLVTIRTTFWRVLGPGAARFRTELIRSTWRYSAGMAALAVLTTLLTQLDKLVVSRMLPLGTFAHYSLAGALAQVPVIVGVAVATAVFPRLTALAAGGPSEGLRRLYHAGCQLAAVLTIPLGLTLAAFSREVLGFWTRSPATAAEAGAAAGVLLIGSTALALQLVPFQLALAFGWVGLNLRLAAGSLLVMAPALWWLVSRFGLVGAASAWLALNLVTTPIMVVTLHRRVLPGATAAWWMNDVLRPLLATIAVLVLARGLAPRLASSAHGFAFALAVGVVALAAALAASPAARDWLRRGRSFAPAP